MGTTGVGLRRHGGTIVLLAILGIAATLTVTSCGSGSGSSPNGELCNQCGDSDGFCQGEKGIPPMTVSDGDGLPCDADTPGGAEVDRPCTLSLTCLRKLDDGQRRCFPIAYDPQFRCGGSRPNLEVRATDTPTPMVRTPTPTATFTPGGGVVTPTPTATPIATVTATPDTGSGAFCGDGEVEDDEECDVPDPNDPDLCEDFCDSEDDTRAVPCVACRWDFAGCLNPETCTP
jgi:hypothetical protein